MADDLGLRPLVARCYHALGTLFRRMGRRQEAQGHLAPAATMYRQMDMRVWLEKAEEELASQS